MELLNKLVSQPALLYPSLIVVALCVGSFLNVVIHRLPLMMQADWRNQCEAFLEVPEGERQAGEHLSLSRPGSQCPHCGHGIRAWENIPVLSYLLLRGRCSACGQSISIRYPLVELATGIFSLITVVLLGPQWAGLLALPLVWALVALALIDLDTQLLPDSITLPLLWLGLIINSQAVFVPFQEAFWGAVAGYLSLWSVYHLFRLVTGKEGMGHGDFKLLAALGAWLGWQMLPVIILLSSLVGAIVGITLILFRGHDRQVPIPFGPYLAAAGLLALWWGNTLVALWLDTLGAP